MSKNVATVTSNTSLVDVAKIMYKMNIGSVPVVEGNKVTGIVTDRDIVLRQIAQGKNPGNSTVEDVMTSGISTATPEMDVHDAIRLMSEKQVRRLPVVENDSLVGMLAIGDVAVRSKLEDDAGVALGGISVPTGTH
jgi:CBS domain-containing protein